MQLIWYMHTTLIIDPYYQKQKKEKKPSRDNILKF